MAEEDTIVVELNDSFYRDRFWKVILLFACMVIAIILLAVTSVYLMVTKPPPQYFRVGDEWRTQPIVPINQAYLARADILQWTRDALQQVFTLDFIHYQDELESYKKFFTPDGWIVFQNQINNYVNYDVMKTGMLFSVVAPDQAPYVVNQGLLSGRYAWWVQMPIRISFTGVSKKADEKLTLQVLVARVPTTENLDGVAIDNIIVDTKADGRK